MGSVLLVVKALLQPVALLGQRLQGLVQLGLDGTADIGRPVTGVAESG